MPSWSVLTSGWGKRTGSGRERGRRQREGFEIGQQGEKRRGMKGQWFHALYAGEAKEGETGI